MDAAFIRTSLSAPEDLTLHPLVEEPMVVALPSEHVLAKDDATGIPLTRLANETFILYGPPGTGMYDATIAACQAAGFNPRVGNLGASTQQAPRITSTLSLVSAGLGVSCVPASMQRMSLEGVVFRRLKGPAQPKAVLNLARRRGDASSVLRRFISVVRETAEETGPD